MAQTATTTARTIITHVGTSLLNCAALRRSEINLKDVQTKLDGDRDPSEEEREAVVNAVRAGLAEFWKKDGHAPKLRREASSGELASLSLMNLQDTDRIVLLHTDTAHGRFWAAVLKDALTFLLTHTELDYPRCRADVEVVPVDRLKVVDKESDAKSKGAANSFVEVGLVSYVERVWNEYVILRSNREVADRELILNITGGYKGLVPIARDVALLLGNHQVQGHPPVACRLSYLYQSSDALIDYGTLPVEFTWNLASLDIEGAATAVGTTFEPLEKYKKAFFEEVHGKQPGDASRWRLSALGTVVLALQVCLHGRSR